MSVAVTASMVSVTVAVAGVVSGTRFSKPPPEALVIVAVFEEASL
nr:hypothetical protein [Rhizobium mesoamericanum]